MFRKRKPEPQARQAAKPTVKLTAAEKREISRILETARGDGKVHSAQDTLPFRQMYPDGLCKLDDHTWSKCIEFEDVNYQLAKPDDQTAIFEALCDMYNAHDASIGMQLSLVSRRMNREDFVKRIEIAAQGDHFDHIRELYTQMLRKQLEQAQQPTNADLEQRIARLEEIINAQSDTGRNAKAKQRATAAEPAGK